MPEPLEESEVEAELEGLDVDAPRVGIVMGSKSDLETMQKAADELKERGILHEMRVMSAHREPDLVAEYAKNARMRGLRVIIAGAGISAALPGAVAAHTELPVIGVPLSGRLSRGRRPRCDPVDRADAPRSAGRVRGSRQPPQRRHPRRPDPPGMIARYTRPELGRLWSDEARMQAWRRVEVAAAEELPFLLGSDGPTEAELEAIRGASFTVEAVQERERVTDHDVAAFVDVLGASAGEAGRWIHFGLTSSDVLDTALALQLRDAGRADPRRRRRAGAGAGGSRPRADRTPWPWAGPTASTPSPRALA